MDNCTRYIHIRGARQNNLKNIDLDIPHNKLIAVTGVSGSGKSSLAFDTIAAEGRRQYLESIPSFARQFAGKINKADTDEISGLYPVISIGQKPPGNSPKSTMGTVSGIYDYLRLLYARFGLSSGNIKLSRSLFSFNSPLGACSHCQGLGLEEKISVDKLIADPLKTLREGAMVTTLPNGYIMYSQVTINVLDTVCREHGFNVDIPWNELSEEQKRVILYGSDRIKVLKGKHPIESRLKWTGLKARPREYGYYLGMINIMEDILRRDRNRNILRFTESLTCSHCEGKRLNRDALSVKYHGYTIDRLCEMDMHDLSGVLDSIKPANRAEKNICDKIISQIEILNSLGNGHLILSRNTDSLSGGELLRIRLANQLASTLTNVLYVFDEPSIGMHPRDTRELINILQHLVLMGNTVIIVEHDPEIIRNADWIIETGPVAGAGGGEIMYNGPANDFLNSISDLSPTQIALQQEDEAGGPGRSNDYYSLSACRKNNLKGINARFRLASVNVVTGVPGSGKGTLVYGCLAPSLKRLIRIDRSPIGRTPRSNPATYTKLSDHVRDLFAHRPLARELGYKKGRFSFNNRGGRCEKCEGAGKIQVGMHYMGNIDIICDKCYGRRFNEDTLRIEYKGKNISDIYDMTINQAAGFLAQEKEISRYLGILQSLGLGYLKLGQSSTTLSGGEAQRIKLAAALSRKFSPETWIILDEPTTGLHHADTIVLIRALRKLAERGNTIVAIEYQEQFIRSADWIIDLGPGSGSKGGELVYEGEWKGFTECEKSVTALHLCAGAGSVASASGKSGNHDSLIITNCTTNNLRGIDISIPLNKLTVITGISGSGKSSLAFDTIYSEAQSRFTENLSTFSRTFIKQSNQAEAENFSNLTPAVAVNRKNLPLSPRSTVGTITGIYEKYRYLFSRVAQSEGLDMRAKEFAFNHEAGACDYCSGLGIVLKADRNRLVSDWNLSVAGGALTGNTTIRYYGHPDSQFVAVLKEAGKEYGIDINIPLGEYSPEQLDIIFDGTGDTAWTAEWMFRNRRGSGGSREISAVWKGFSRLVEEEYHRRLHNKNIDAVRSLLYEENCPECHGARVNEQARSVYAGGLNIAGLSELSVNDTIRWFEEMSAGDSPLSGLVGKVYDGVASLLVNMQLLGLGHIGTDRRSSSLSGGEGQRLRLAHQLSGGLCGMTFVLDEPTIGLHQKDTGRLMKVIGELKDKGNTIILVEHDREVIRRADYIIEMGPGSGKEGGKIVAEGILSEFIKSDKAITPAFLGDYKPQNATVRSLTTDAFGLRGVNKHNLVNRDFSFVAGGIIAVTGVSGAGKSTLVHHVLSPSLERGRAVNCDAFYERAGFDQYITVDHRAISGNIMSTVASYSGLLDKAMSMLAASEDATARGLRKAYFSYNNKNGRCPVCNGAGMVRISMDFMDDVWNLCESCKGQRYKELVLEVQQEGKNIADILQLTVNESIEYFRRVGGRAGLSSQAAVCIMEQLRETGLGHLVLGQALQSLSGGEAQRLKLSMKLMEGKGRRILYMFDEPSSGLYYPDIEKLIIVFNRLVDEGHTVLFIEHNPYLISIANQVVEL